MSQCRANTTGKKTRKMLELKSISEELKEFKSPKGT
jgi:hypothetical protein